MRATLFIDFDGCLHDQNHVLKGYKMGVPVLGALEGMRRLRELDCELVIFTVRATSAPSTKAVADWLDYFGIPYDRITATKGNADLYIDDHGYHFSTWPELTRLAALQWPRTTAESPAEHPALPDPQEW